MEMDIGAHNYPFQCFLSFLTLKLHQSFPLTTINHKRSTLSHNFSHNRKIYLIRKLLTKFRFQKFHSFLILIMNQYAPHQIFLLVLAIILTQEICNQKKSVENVCFVIFVWLGSYSNSDTAIRQHYSIQ